MNKIPKLLLVAAMGLLSSTSGCDKKEVDPTQLEFYCNEPEKTIQTFVNQEGVVKKSNYIRLNPKQTDVSKSNYLVRRDIFVLQVINSTNVSDTITLIPKELMDKSFEVVGLKIKFSGEMKNCEISNGSDPYLDIISLPKIFILGNKFNLTKIIKN